MEYSPKEQMERLHHVLSEKQGQEISVIDIREISSLADYFIITHGNNTPHVDALVDAVEETMDKLQVPCRSREGLRGGRWVLLDYGDVVVNVFSKEDRMWYDLERLWRDGKLVNPDQPGDEA